MYYSIIELVDSISRDGPDTPIYVIQNKKPKYSVQIHFCIHFAPPSPVAKVYNIAIHRYDIT